MEIPLFHPYIFKVFIGASQITPSRCLGIGGYLQAPGTPRSCWPQFRRVYCYVITPQMGGVTGRRRRHLPEATWDPELVGATNFHFHPWFMYVRPMLPCQWVQFLKLIKNQGCARYNCWRVPLILSSLMDEYDSIWPDLILWMEKNVLKRFRLNSLFKINDHFSVAILFDRQVLPSVFIRPSVARLCYAIHICAFVVILLAVLLFKF